MSKSLIVGISGVRGIVGETLTPELLTRLGAAFGTYIHGGKVVVGMDTRTSGPMIKYAVVSGLLSTGCTVVDLNISTTPSCQLMIRELNADGGIIISGSHNPAEWNALKFFRSDGIYLNEREARDFLNIYYQGDFYKSSWDKIKPVVEETATEKHIEKVLRLVDVESIRKKRIKVAIDCCNGAGSIITPQLLESLGCEVIKIHCEPNGFFPHNPEPTFINLGDLANKVFETGADIGFAQDPDADRVAIIPEDGKILSEEYTLSIVTKFILGRKRGPVVTNLSTTRMLDDIAKEYGCEVIRTPVGEVNVAEKMKELNAIIGGEGNGGVIYPELQYARDSLIAISLILEYMAKSNRSILEIVNEIPKYYIEKRKVECDRGEAIKILEKMKQKYKNEDVNLQDGIRVDWEDSWLHIRPSNTEPVIRVIVESRSKKKTVDICNEVLTEIEDYLQK